MREEIIMADVVLLIIMCTSMGSWAGIIGTLLRRTLDWVPVVLTYFVSAAIGLILPLVIGAAFSNYGEASLNAAMAFCSFLPAQLGASMVIGLAENKLW